MIKLIVPANLTQAERVVGDLISTSEFRPLIVGGGVAWVLNWAIVHMAAELMVPQWAMFAKIYKVYYGEYSGFQFSMECLRVIRGHVD